ncbi:MAG: sulfurtransferase TusA family protein [Bacteroidota bacterium]|jgi:tRNA 2-thiouridine synthesizing protein A
MDTHSGVEIETAAMADKLLDTKGLNCPLPILKLKKAIQEVPVGGTLEVLATDPGSGADFDSFCRQTSHEILEQAETDGVYRFLIRRAV